VARVEVSAAAAEDLQALIVTHSLPPDTRERVKRSLRPLERFPLMGAELSGRWGASASCSGPGAGC
jgi:hypothetical protein